MRFQLLGRIGLENDGVELPVRGRRERFVLASLLAARGRVVSVDRLIEDFWGTQPGENALASLQVAVSRLRSLIEPGRVPRAATHLLISRPGGYVLSVPPDAVDAERFNALVDQARTALAAGQSERAALLGDEAVALWVGEPFAGAPDSASIRSEVARLTELRLLIAEIRAEALLRLGSHQLLVPDLEVLVMAHPFRERLWELYALALYRSGRQGDALAALRRARRGLADELGVDLSPTLRQLEVDILRHAHHLQPPRSGRQIRRRLDLVRKLGGDPPRPSLVGREAVMTGLDRCLRETTQGIGQTILIVGADGIGKTRILNESAELAVAQGFRVLQGASAPTAPAPPYWSWLPIARTLIADDLRHAQASIVTRLSGAGPSAPTLIVIDDLDRADPWSITLVEELSAAFARTPTMILTALRRPAQPEAALDHLLHRSSAGLRFLDLDPLPTSKIDQLINSLLTERLDVSRIDLITERAAGNPLYAIELLRLMVVHDIETSELTTLESLKAVHDVLALRLQDLPDPVRRILSVAALIGEDFRLELIAQSARIDPDDAVDLLDQAVEGAIIKEDWNGAGYQFTHPLFRQTLTASLSRHRSARIHAAVAVALEPQLAKHPELIWELTAHLLAGCLARPALAESAIRHAVRAAEQADSWGATSHALDYRDQARQVLDLITDADARARAARQLGFADATPRGQTPDTC